MVMGPRAAPANAFVQKVLAGQLRPPPYSKTSFPYSQLEALEIGLPLWKYTESGCLIQRKELNLVFLGFGIIYGGSKHMAPLFWSPDEIANITMGVHSSEEVCAHGSRSYISIRSFP